MAWETDQVMEESGESTGVCGSGGAGRLAAEAGVGTLVLVHTGPRVSQARDEAIKDAATYFKGETVFADEVSVIELAADRA